MGNVFALIIVEEEIVLKENTVKMEYVSQFQDTVILMKNVITNTIATDLRINAKFILILVKKFHVTTIRNV